MLTHCNTLQHPATQHNICVCHSIEAGMEVASSDLTLSHLHHYQPLQLHEPSITVDTSAEAHMTWLTHITYSYICDMTTLKPHSVLLSTSNFTTTTYCNVTNSTLLYKSAETHMTWHIAHSYMWRDSEAASNTSRFNTADSLQSHELDNSRHESLPIPPTLIERNPPPWGGFLFTISPDQEPCVKDFTTRCDGRISSWILLHTALDQGTTQRRNPPGGGGFLRSSSPPRLTAKSRTRQF